MGDKTTIKTDGVKITPPRDVRDILSVLAAAGYDACLVGGCVRDALLGRRPNDWDVASSASPEAVVRLFPRTVRTGIRHGTVTVLHGNHTVEVTAFRAESAYSDHRRPDSVRFTGDLAGDLARRDFTINAIAMRADGSLYDPFGGRADLAARVLRCVGDPEVRFGEDALRMLRAYRFSAQLGFALDPDTETAILKKAPLSGSLSPERIRDELIKTLYSPRPEVIGSMIGAGLLDTFLTRGSPDLSALAALPKYARPARLGFELERAVCIMSTYSFFTALRLDNKTVGTAAGAAEILKSGSRDWKRLLRDFGRDAALAAYPNNRALRKVLRSGECWRLADLAVGGKDLIALGYSGTAIGDALDKLLDHVIDYPQDNSKYTLCKLAARS
jgi:tRNA nucleotidyltransferase (CCA-adding enzyme)